MWYLTWILGTAFAVTFGIVNALRFDLKIARSRAANRNYGRKGKSNSYFKKR